MRYSGIICFALLAFFAAGVPASAQDVAAPVAACIHENAAKVEEAVPSLTDATNFLVDNVCAPEVTTEIARQEVARIQKFADDMKNQCLKDAATKTAPGGAASCTTFDKAPDVASLFSTGPLGSLFSPKKLPEATALAAKLLLDLRIAHSKSGTH